ncbi:hypothetical protein, partial [Stutzerimonas nitrititolerans]|uniref:hypothetical protein n=1 Tax=Stutzerimonas nitrititolerans TaxID=2482751 RepID=UPI0028ACD0D9
FQSAEQPLLGQFSVSGNTAWKNSLRASSNFGNQTVRPSTSNTKHRCPDISGFAASLLASLGQSPNCLSRQLSIGGSTTAFLKPLDR